MSVNDADTDDERILPAAPVRNLANRPLAQSLANLVLEAQQHRSGLRALYVALCAMEMPAPTSWGYSLIEEYERHHAQTEQNVRSLHVTMG